MGEHRTPASKAAIASLIALGKALGYHVQPEWPIPTTGPQPERVDIALFVSKRASNPAFIVEVDSTDGAAATSNAVKVFGKQTSRLVKPFFLYHVFLETAAEGQRVDNLSTLFDKINYQSYDFGRSADRQLFVQDLIAHHAILGTSLDMEELAGALDDSAWDALNPVELLEAVAGSLGSEMLPLSTLASVSVHSRRFSNALAWLARRPIGELSFGVLSFAGTMFTIPLLRGLRALLATSTKEIAAEYEALRRWQSEPEEIIFSGERSMVGLSPDFDYAVIELAPPIFCLVVTLFARYEQGAQELCRQMLGRALHSGLSSVWSRYALAWCVIASLRCGGAALAVAEAAIAEINRLGGLPLSALPYLAPPAHSEDEERLWELLMKRDDCVVVSVNDFSTSLLSVSRNGDSLMRLIAEILVEDETLADLNRRIVCTPQIA